MIAIATTVTTTTCATATGIEIETITAITIITDTNAKTRGIAVVRGTIALTLENACVIIVNTTDGLSRSPKKLLPQRIPLS